MKIFVPVTSKNIEDAEISEHFGKSKLFALIDYEDDEIKDVRFIERNTEEHRVGEIPQLAKESGAEIIIVSNIGERAFEILNEMGITVIVGVNGKLKDVIENIKANFGEKND